MENKKHPWYKSPLVAFAVVLVALEFIAKTLKGAQPVVGPQGQPRSSLNLPSPGPQPDQTLAVGSVLTIIPPQGGIVTGSTSSDSSAIFPEPVSPGGADFVGNAAASAAVTVTWQNGDGTTASASLTINGTASTSAAGTLGPRGRI